jgi:hypothetical protein
MFYGRSFVRTHTVSFQNKVCFFFNFIIIDRRPHAHFTMQARKLFYRPFDITQFRRASPTPIPPSSAATAAASPPFEEARTPVPIDSEPPQHIDGAVPQFVKKPVPTPPRNPLLGMHTLPPPLIIEDQHEEEVEEGTKKSKKHKKDKKHRRLSLNDEEDELGLLALCQAAGLDHVAPTPVPVPVSTVHTPAPTSKKRAFDEAFGASVYPEYTFDSYMQGAGQTVNDEVRGRHSADVSAFSSTSGKSLGERKYGCTFCGSMHQLECLVKGGDPPCIRNGAFAKFIQDFLFKYDIAPGQEWRNMFLLRTPGYRRAMADRFAVITSITTSTEDDMWTSFLHRRAWDTREVQHTSNAGTSRELFQQNRAAEFIYFNSSGASSPRPSSVVTALSPVHFQMGHYAMSSSSSSSSPVPLVPYSSMPDVSAFPIR